MVAQVLASQGSLWSGLLGVTGVGVMLWGAGRLVVRIVRNQTDKSKKQI